jgi:endonuclease/exonuclease/phosphatase family metal-dependent hydrolase
MKVLTFNICWEAMTLNKQNLKRNGGHAKYLGEKCVLNKKGDATVCLDNIVKMIDQTKTYDVIALQEALNYQTLIKKSDTLKKMKYYKSRSGKEILVTFYNKHKYKLVKGYSSEFVKGRPFHVIVLESKSGKQIVVVNLHTGHKELSKKLFIEKTLNKFLRETIDLTNKKLIILGDFNNNKIKTLKVMGRKLKSSKKKYREIVDNVLSEEKVKINRYLKCNLGSDHIGLVCDA